LPGNGLTGPELAAILQLLQDVGGLLEATGTSEMLVTYPSQSRAHEAPIGARRRRVLQMAEASSSGKEAGVWIDHL
jgi:hypothetical protein